MHLTDHDASRKVSAQLSLLACAVLWSTGGLFIKSVTWSPLAIAGFRSLIGAVVLLVWLRKPKFHFSFPQIAAAVAYSATMLLFVWANRVTTAANTILLQYTAPVWVALFSGILLGEKPVKRDWFTLLLVAVGLVFFFMEQAGGGNPFGDGLALASGVVFGFFAIFMRMQKDSSPLESILLGHIITFVISIPVIVTDPPRVMDLPFLFGLGLFQIGAASILFAYGIKYVPALQSMLISVAEPILNPVWVFIFLGEVPAPLAAVGGLIILVSVTGNSLLASLPRDWKLPWKWIPPEHEKQD